jgi:hypothetical protein
MFRKAITNLELPIDRVSTEELINKKILVAETSASAQPSETVFSNTIITRKGANPMMVFRSNLPFPDARPTRIKDNATTAMASAVRVVNARVDTHAHQTIHTRGSKLGFMGLSLRNHKNTVPKVNPGWHVTQD